MAQFGSLLFFFTQTISFEECHTNLCQLLTLWAESTIANSASLLCNIAAASRTMTTLHNFRVVKNLLQALRLFLFFVSIAISKKFLHLQ